MSTLLPDPLARAAALAPERPALIADEATLSYAALDAAASRAAGSLRALGLHDGDRLGLLARNVPAAIVAVHAARRARLILVPLHPRSSSAELAFALVDAGVGLLLHDGATAAQAAAAARDGSARALSRSTRSPTFRRRRSTCRAFGSRTRRASSTRRGPRPGRRGWC